MYKRLTPLVGVSLFLHHESGLGFVLQLKCCIFAVEIINDLFS